MSTIFHIEDSEYGIFIPEVAQGSYGAVYKGIKDGTNREVAVKKMSKKKITKKAFESEIQLQRSVEHANVLPLWDSFETKDSYFFVYPFASNGDLAKTLKERKVLCEKEACEMFIQILDALECLHSKNIAHRDIKPQNILIFDSNRYVLIDFGHSKICDFTLTRYIGTPLYNAPEIMRLRTQKRDQWDSYDAKKTDFWSLGLTLYKALYGNIPENWRVEMNGSAEENERKYLRKIDENEAEFPKDCNEEAKEVLRKLLVVDPKKRTNSFEELRNCAFVRKHSAKISNQENGDIKEKEQLVEGEKESLEFVQKISKLKSLSKQNISEEKEKAESDKEFTQNRKKPIQKTSCAKYPSITITPGDSEKSGVELDINPDKPIPETHRNFHNLSLPSKAPCFLGVNLFHHELKRIKFVGNTAESIKDFISEGLQGKNPIFLQILILLLMKGKCFLADAKKSIETDQGKYFYPEGNIKKDHLAQIQKEFFWFSKKLRFVHLYCWRLLRNREFKLKEKEHIEEYIDLKKVKELDAFVDWVKAKHMRIRDREDLRLKGLLKEVMEEQDKRTKSLLVKAYFVMNLPRFDENCEFSWDEVWGSVEAKKVEQTYTNLKGKGSFEF